jgi:hypothetical protein
MVVLLTGLVALAGSSALVTRQLGLGRSIGGATQLAIRRQEALRAAAHRRTLPGDAMCRHPSFASGSNSERTMREVWTVAPDGDLRTATVVVTFARVGGTSQVALHTLIACY